MTLFDTNQDVMIVYEKIMNTACYLHEHPDGYRVQKLYNGLLDAAEFVLKTWSESSNKELDQYRCCKCLRIGYARRRLRNLANARASVRNHYYANKQVYNQRSAEYRKRNPEKCKARELVRTAIRSGRLQKQPCVVCGKPAQAHHEDYANPLEVTWYCKQHHEDRHHLNGATK